MELTSGLNMFLIFYLAVGFIYASYILLFAGDLWYAFPINMLFGPVYIVQVIFKYRKLHPNPSYKDVFYGKKVAIFDLDGTLIDSSPIWLDAFSNVKFEVGLEALIIDFPPGVGILDCWKNLLKSPDFDKNMKFEFTPEQLAEKTEVEYLSLFEDVALTEGFWSVAADLKENGFRLALASNTNKHVVTEVLKRLGIENVFEQIICGDDVKKKKPNPEMYKTLAKNMGVKPKECVVFEDAVVGAKASVAAGMETVVIWNGEYDQDVYPKGIKFFLPDFTDLPGNLFKTNKERVLEAAKEYEEEISLANQ
ncbi:HAD family phosphatase [candidate division WWE3 bacterium]|nr:HAD family phosphatase [candidate division WWE3 bacterium]